MTKSCESSRKQGNSWHFAILPFLTGSQLRHSFDTFALYLHIYVLHSFFCIFLLKMPRRAARAHGAPYTKVLSALLKPDLVRLCGEFRLAADGSVVNLRKRLKDHLNLNRDRIYRDHRYRALYPKHRRVGEPAAREQSPVLSDRSFDSWHGIGGQPQDVPQVGPLPDRSPTPSLPSDPDSDDDGIIPHGSPQPGERKPLSFLLSPTSEFLGVTGTSLFFIYTSRCTPLASRYSSFSEAYGFSVFLENRPFLLFSETYGFSVFLWNRPSLLLLLFISETYGFSWFC